MTFNIKEFRAHCTALLKEQRRVERGMARIEGGFTTNAKAYRALGREYKRIEREIERIEGVVQMFNREFDDGVPI